jgi:hypothetical protein
MQKRPYQIREDGLKRHLISQVEVTICTRNQLPHPALPCTSPIHAIHTRIIALLHYKHVPRRIFRRVSTPPLDNSERRPIPPDFETHFF